jgi:urea transport system ATP-binding protein
MLATEGLNQFYGGSHILWDVDLVVPKGACTVLMGRNGVGKTTLLRTIMGTVSAASGHARFEEHELIGRPPEIRGRLGIGYVPQGREIFGQLTVEENLRVGLAARRDRSREIPEFIFELFPVLKEMLGRRGGDLSGGQQQQLAIGRALVAEPTLLVLDEPTEGIQPNVVHQIGDVIQELNRRMGLTVLLVEQKLPFARRVADRFCLMEKGRIVAQGAMEELGEELIDHHLSV